MHSKKNYIKEYFDNSFSSSNVTSDEERRLNETIQLIPSSVRTILDAGCGDCRLSNLIQHKGCHTITSMDISMGGLKNARSRAVNGMVNSLPFQDNSFDLVINTEVLEHLPMDIYYESINELLRVSRKFVLITVPNNENLLHNQIRCNHCNKEAQTWGHLRSFNNESFTFLTSKVANVKVFEIGNTKRERSLKLLYFIVRKYGKYYDLSNGAVCINCGKVISDNIKQNMIGAICIRLIWRIDKYFPNTKSGKNWLSFLIQK